MMHGAEFLLSSHSPILNCVIEQIPYLTEQELGEDLDLEAEDDSDWEDDED